jgi:hypothetical protein
MPQGRPRAVLLMAVAASAIALSLTASIPRAVAAPVKPADRAATHAYLLANVALWRAVAASQNEALASTRALAARIGGECPGVLAGAPTGEGIGSPGAPPPTSRQIGESNRQREQLGELTQEVEAALGSTASSPARSPAVVAFIAAVRPLRWSKPAITQGVQRYLTLLETIEPTPHNIDVCADMRAWVASGYRTLSPATKALASSELTAPLPVNVSVIPPQAPQLAPYEGPAERRLLAEARVLRLSGPGLPQQLNTLTTGLEATLGIHPFEPSLGEQPAKGSVVIGRGRTADGETFVARLEPPAPGQGGCALNVSITSAPTGGTVIGGGLFKSGATACLTKGRRAAEPSVNCDSGQLTIQSNTLPATRRVRLRLSDGRTITSAAIVVPARLGGPAGIYYQVVRGPSPIPVSLTELDGHGRTLRVVRLPAIVECTQHPLKFLPGGIRTLVRARVPGGPRFSIEAQRYRFLGHVYLDLKLHTAAEGSSLGALELSSGPSSFPFRTLPHSPFVPEESSGCTPGPYTIVYGILKRPRDTVLARTAAGLQPLQEVAMPASLHAGGVLAYGVFLPPPSELVLLAPGGRTLLHESLAEGSRGQVELCEGESEVPPAAAPASP